MNRHICKNIVRDCRIMDKREIYEKYKHLEKYMGKEDYLMFVLDAYEMTGGTSGVMIDMICYPLKYKNVKDFVTTIVTDGVKKGISSQVIPPEKEYQIMVEFINALITTKSGITGKIIRGTKAIVNAVTPNIVWNGIESIVKSQLLPLIHQMIINEIPLILDTFMKVKCKQTGGLFNGVKKQFGKFKSSLKSEMNKIPNKIANVAVCQLSNNIESVIPELLVEVIIIFVEHIKQKLAQTQSLSLVPISVKNGSILFSAVLIWRSIPAIVLLLRNKCPQKEQKTIPNSCDYVFRKELLANINNTLGSNYQYESVLEGCQIFERKGISVVQNISLPQKSHKLR